PGWLGRDPCGSDMIATRTPMREIAVVLILAGAVAHAQEMEDPDTEIAKRHFATGNAYYTAKRYDEALHEFIAAKKVKSAPALEYNIGRCYDRLEQPKDAISAYER